MSFNQNESNLGYKPGYFLADAEDCTRITYTISQSHAAVVTANGKKHVPAGSVIPANGSTAVGIPARVVSKKTRTATDLDQIHIPDPVSAEIRSLKEKTAKLEKAILAFQQKDGEGKQK